jgi:hypothetical protein
VALAERSASGGRFPAGPAPQAPLDLHKGIDDPPVPAGSRERPDPAAGGCLRWPEHERLLSNQGELVRGRCRATNLCPYCARLFAVETSEMLMLDAMEYAPTVYAVLTARELLERPECRRHLTQLRRSLRKRWPAIEWAVLIEFQRRGALHLNLLIKGVPVDDVAELHRRMADLWCSRVDAVPAAQFVGPVGAAEGLVRYVTQHFMKPAQAPPIGWRGHRYSATRGYLVRPASVMREEARTALRGKRALAAAIRAGHEGHEAELVAHQALEVAAATTWRLYTLPAAALAPSTQPSPAERTPSRALADRSLPAPDAGGSTASAPPVDARSSATADVPMSPRRPGEGRVAPRRRDSAAPPTQESPDAPQDPRRQWPAPQPPRRPARPGRRPRPSRPSRPAGPTAGPAGSPPG